MTDQQPQPDRKVPLETAAILLGRPAGQATRLGLPILPRLPFDRASFTSVAAVEQRLGAPLTDERIAEAETLRQEWRERERTRIKALHHKQADTDSQEAESARVAEKYMSLLQETRQGQSPAHLAEIIRHDPAAWFAAITAELFKAPHPLDRHLWKRERKKRLAALVNAVKHGFSIAEGL